MDKIIEMRQKRAKAWEDAKNFLDTHADENGLLSAEDEATYDKMEADISKLGTQIDRLERQKVIDRELSKPVSEPITQMPATAKIDTKTGRKSDEYKENFWNAMRQKNPDLKIVNALQVGDDAEGGYLVPDEFERTLIDGLEDNNIFRTLAHVIKTSSGLTQIPVVASHGSASWIAEEGSYVESDDSFNRIQLSSFKLGTMIKISEELMNDSAFELDKYLATEFARRIGNAEEEAFITGNGTGKPTGILNATGGAQLGVTTASSTALTADELIDLYHSLGIPYRKKAAWLVNDSTIQAIRKLKDSNNQYLWQPSLVAGNPDTILGIPVKVSRYMPEIAAGAKTVAIGDYSYYWIADRQGRSFKRLDELFAATGQIGFRGSQRVDGKLTLPEAVKVLQMKGGSGSSTGG